MIKRFIPICLVFLAAVSCFQEKEYKSESQVVVRIKRYPNSINYLISNSPQSTLIEKHIFNTLLWIDKNGIVNPMLVDRLPEVSRDGSNVILSYEIRDEALWDNQEQITSNDVLFSLKVFKLPIVDNVEVRIYLGRITGAFIDIENSKSISFKAQGNIQEVINLTGDFDILQKSKYDPKGLLNHITIEDIVNKPEQVASDKNVKKFITEFLKDNFKFKNNYLSGSGPYEIAGMDHGKFIQLKKKENWWGDKLVGKLPQFHANLKKIIYVCIPEPLVALQALRTKSIDVMDDIPSSEFVQLKRDSSFIESYDLFSPLKYKFTYIGLNSRVKYFNNIDIRKAIAYLMKPEDILKVVELGYAERTIGPVNPTNEYFYNNAITPRAYDPKQAQKIFIDNGFQLIDNILVDSKTKEPLELEVSFRKNPGFQNIAFMLKEEARMIGIKLNLKQYEGRIMSKMARNHDFEIMIGTFNGNPISLEFSEIFSQEASKVNGMNFTGFGNDKSDSLIHAANYAEDSVSKRQALFALQEELHEEATMLFLYFSKNKIAISKKFDNLKISSTKPGYDVTSFILKDSTNSN